MDVAEIVETFRNLAFFLGALALICILLFSLLLAFSYRKVKNLNIPIDADLTETLSLIPLGLVIAIDLLDLGLDFFAAPITWIVLDRLNLRALRNISTIEAIIPLTGPIPTLTIAWLAVRLFGFRL